MRSVPVSVSDVTQVFVSAPKVEGHRPISCTFDGSWSYGMPVMGCPVANNGGYGARIIDATNGKISLTGSVIFVYALE